MRSQEFLAGLLDPARAPFVTAEDLDGPHGGPIRLWQESQFIAWDPGLHPAPTCPHCGEGVPYRAEGRLLCSHCRSALDPRELLAWVVHREKVFTALAAHLGLRGTVTSLDGVLWELGSAAIDGAVALYCYHPGGVLSEDSRLRLAAFRRVVLIQGPATTAPDGPWRRVRLSDLLTPDGTFAGVSLADLGRDRGQVRFDADSGTLRVGNAVAGEVPVGSREWALLACLAEQLGQFVPYRELKRAVLARTGGRAETDEATFCQKVKSRAKRFIPAIDRLVVTSNKGDGYRLRAEAEACGAGPPASTRTGGNVG